MLCLKNGFPNIFQYKAFSEARFSEARFNVKIKSLHFLMVFVFNELKQNRHFKNYRNKDNPNIW